MTGKFQNPEEKNTKKRLSTKIWKSFTQTWSRSVLQKQSHIGKQQWNILLT